MSQSVITARIDEKDKEKFDAFCSNVGLTASSAINIFVKAVIRENKIPFEISQDPFFSAANMDYVLKSVEELKAGKGTSHELLEVDEW